MAFKLRIGSRPSRLALVQAAIVRARLQALIADLAVEIVEIRTTGDKLKSASLARVGGKGLFIRELEQALRARSIDLAVHSMKDLPAALPAEFRLAAVPERQDTRDALVSRAGAELGSMRAGSRIGTSSLRRRYQALRVNPRLAIEPLRGNIDTRLKRVAEGDLDAIIIAMAGLGRLGRLGELPVVALDERDFIPAGGQAALAVEALADGPAAGSNELERALEAINDPAAAYETAAERAFLAMIGASCATPVGVRAAAGDSTLSIRAILFAADGSRELADSLDAPVEFNLSAPVGAGAGAMLARRMLARGAGALIADG
jgi:hydroxymethylbilane synthase